MIEPLLDLPAHLRRRMADALASGLLAAPFSAAALRSVLGIARHLKEKIDGVLSHCRWPLHTSLLEGINNKIKVIKRTACGTRDDDDFFLNYRAAFPGIPR